jgi:hypothetical protein
MPSVSPSVRHKCTMNTDKYHVQVSTEPASCQHFTAYRTLASVRLQVKSLQARFGMQEKNLSSQFRRIMPKMTSHGLFFKLQSTKFAITARLFASDSFPILLNTKYYYYSIILLYRSFVFVRAPYVWYSRSKSCPLQYKSSRR